MNPETGRIYHGEDAIRAAQARGEYLVPVNEKSSLERSPLERPELEARRTGRAVSFSALQNERRRQEKKRTL